MSPTVEELVGVIYQIAESQEQIKQQQDEILEALQPAFMTRGDIARDLKRSTEWIRLHPWALPNNSKPDIEGNPALWRRESWQEWKQNMLAHERRWNLMTHADKERALGISA